MESASRVLVAGGMGVLSLGLLLGIPMAIARRRTPQAPRYLVTAHLGSIIQGGILLALTAAVEVSSLSGGMDTVAASLVLAGVALFELGNVTNWLRGVQDGFAEQAVGSTVAALGTPLMLVGTGILAYGVATGL